MVSESNMPQSANQTPILITGVSKRIGFALAKEFLQQDQPVVGTYRQQRPELMQLQALGAKLYQADFYRNQSIQQLIVTLSENYPTLRAIIHNASEWLADSANLDRVEIFRRMMQVHAAAPYQINFALAQCLKNYAKTADIIHITDYTVNTGSTKHVAYAASKAALQNLTLSFAKLLSPKVKVNTIAPSLIMFNPEDDDEYRTRTLDKSLLKIEPGAEEVIQAVQYLLSSDYITGRTLALDGGRHLR
jgi:dihydromonapterin reductase/dihydrofolate reductase